MKRSKTHIVLCCALLPLAAQTQAQAIPEQAPTGIAMGGGLFLKPVLDTSYLMDSNLYRQADNETDASALVISPSLGLEYLTSNNVWRVGYRGDYASYDTDDTDDYKESDFLFDARLNQTGRHRFAVNLARDEGHDPFGTERTEGTPAARRDIDQWVLSSGRAAYTFGAPSALLNLTFSGEVSDKEYQNNRAESQFLDRSIAGLGVDARVRISPRTGLLFDIRQREIDFDRARTGFAPRDGTEQRLRAGMQWFVSSKVVGRVLVGGLRRDFDDNRREDFSSFDWEAAISWRPVSYSEIVVEGGHSLQESYFDQADVIDTTRVGARWIHQWSSLLETGLSADLTSFDFEGFDRSDDIVTGRAYGELELTRNIKARLSFEANNRDSSLQALDFDRTVTLLRLQLAL